MSFLDLAGCRHQTRQQLYQGAGPVRFEVHQDPCEDPRAADREQQGAEAAPGCALAERRGAGGRAGAWRWWQQLL